MALYFSRSVRVGDYHGVITSGVYSVNTATELLIGSKYNAEGLVLDAANGDYITPSSVETLYFANAYDVASGTYDATSGYRWSQGMVKQLEPRTNMVEYYSGGRAVYGKSDARLTLELTFDNLNAYLESRLVAWFRYRVGGGKQAFSYVDAGGTTWSVRWIAPMTSNIISGAQWAREMTIILDVEL